MTELEVAGVLEKALRDEGSEGFPFPIDRRVRPALGAAARARRRRGESSAGDFLLHGFRRRDRAATAPTSRARSSSGRASDEQRESTRSCGGANERRRRRVRAGMTGRDADALARDYIEQRGFGELFGHSLGHGLGLEVHEAPRLATTAEARSPKARW